MSDYQPGTVAVILDRNNLSDGLSDGWRAVKDDKGWSSLAPEIGWVPDADVVSVRPLVVLDLDAIPTTDGLDNPAEYVVRTLRNSGAYAQPTRNAIADQIEAQVKPPRIPEPGKWGVVEAYAPEYDQRLHFVRHHDFVTDGRRWQSGGARYSWAALVDPVLIRDGIEP